jgi:hypothetical protein
MRTAKTLLILLALLWLAPRSKAEVAVLLEEPYSYDGAFAGTGHAAVYLTRVCAESPTRLRRCLPGEPGVVISRYHRIGGYDWLAIPFYPYLYAVDNPSQVPLLANPKLEAALRDRYRRTYLEQIVPDLPDGSTPPGDWYELLGSAYDRTLYAFQIETSADEDDSFIDHYNSQPNTAAYQLVSRNCADFVRKAVNFYYPKAVRRSIIADLAVSTPKHSAKSLAQFSKHHPDLQFTAFVIPQVPGTIRRSRPVRGLMESVFKAKKYELPLLVFYPAVAGGFAAAYIAEGRFNPAQNALIFGTNGELDAPLTAKERRSYTKALAEVARADSEVNANNQLAAWRRFSSTAKLQPDLNGQPTLNWNSGDSQLQLGLTRENILNGSAPADVVQGVLIARLRDELHSGGAPKTSDALLMQDWKLLTTSFGADTSSNETRTRLPIRDLKSGTD